MHSRSLSLPTRWTFFRLTARLPVLLIASVLSRLRRSPATKVPLDLWGSVKLSG